MGIIQRLWLSNLMSKKILLILFGVLCFLFIGPIVLCAQGICYTNFDCWLYEEYCLKPVGFCDEMGICDQIPDFCPQYIDEVCGCDGMTYSNECFAYMNGVSIHHYGSCDPVIDNIIFDNCISEICTAVISIIAYDPFEGELVYTWEALDGGDIIGEGAEVEFDSPGPSAYPACDPYQVKVTVTSDVSGLSAEETIDIYVKLAGDVNGDGYVLGVDRAIVRNNYLQSPFDPRADVNCDDIVSGVDRAIVRNQFGQTGCSCP